MRRERALRILLLALAAVFSLLYLDPRVLTGTDIDDVELDAVPTKSEPANNVTLKQPEHVFLVNGLVEIVDPAAPHPIYELIQKAEAEWKGKLARASTTFTQAVAEYRRRWDYVREHAVELPDEYDQINDDLEPFWGLEPKDFLAIRSELEAKIDSYTVGKSATTGVHVVNTSFAPGKYDQLIKGSVAVVDLLRDVEDRLPPFRAVFSPHDSPNRLSDYFVEEAARRAARQNKYVRRNQLPNIDPTGWISACSPGSPARDFSIDEASEPPPPNSKKTFIHDHKLAMDPCLHPRHFWRHGQLLSYDKGPTPQRELVPEFSYCSSHLHHNIRFPTPYGWVDDLSHGDNPDWQDRPDERVLWRGSNTGIFHSQKTRWRTSQRALLMQLTNNIRGSISILGPSNSPTDPVGQPVQIRSARVNPGIFDVAFAGDPIMCDKQTCELLQKLFPWRKRQSAKDAGEYRYVLDVDGNGWSGRFKRLITSNALVFKASLYPEWWLDRVQPWVHYIPIQLDLNDLHDAVIFFRGDSSGVGAHEDLARKIAEQGRAWSRRFWRREDMVAHFYRLILEYARLMSEDREAMSYHSQTDLSLC
ncbi:hypothetical protein MIND_00606900 [Mycena indigotica]|uniref:Glycosyl transferase CAP10 domain-containing protein n=1 Tax=Mycena indigotica TaxID=2126181 RepID=A0A8H6SRB2_9AGAR|nr:uncharacterized protein MIND_00606900 [Mycena indigotica]KAF7303773.1 hypothetical protein MIND_00606900 [Mycena indigotica]